ncbi:hypothetical protein GW17_00001442 [Ensete ventricosum]|nr:hypothetical protein GW17_00001442 [Ensete ventricosum]
MEGSDGPPMTCEEHEELLLRLRDWRTRLSMELPKIEVRFEDVSVETEVYVRRRVLPTLPNAIINTTQGKDHTREDEGDFVVNYILKLMLIPKSNKILNCNLDSFSSEKTEDGESTNNTIGKTILKSRGMLTESHWYWYSVAILLMFAVVFNIFSILALEYLKGLYHFHSFIFKFLSWIFHKNAAPKKRRSNMKMWPKDFKKIDKADDQATSATSQSRMSLQFQPLTIAFSNISYYVDVPKQLKKFGIKEKRLQLLKGVSGAFRPGVLTALMGVTGAGKTTLLDVLAGRKTVGHIEGSINISGYPKKQETFARVSGYCEQVDNHSPCLTVFESLWYSAWLRLPSQVDVQTINVCCSKTKICYTFIA